MTRSCKELGVCQVEGALAFDLPCPQPCAECDLRVRPIVVDGSTVAVEVSRIEPVYTGEFPFAPGVIEHHRARRSARERAMASVLLLAAAAGVLGLLAGFARGKGWL